jgi:ADP-heptose:LPS heptosyltransferase
MRVVLILPCCIGDVVIATAVLRAVRRAYPSAHITWAIGTWSRPAVAHHPDVNAILDTGSASHPVKTPDGFARFVRQLRAARFDLALSLVRSPLMSAAVALSGISRRAGLDANGRGFGYNIRAPIDPDAVRHEGEIYLDVARAFGIDTRDCWANLPVDTALIDALVPALPSAYIVLNPSGGRNPGMTLDLKRYPPHQFAALANRLYAHYRLPYVIIGAQSDQPIIDALTAHLTAPYRIFAGALTFAQIGALAARGFAYIGNDTGLTHLAAASGARTVMILGPTDPHRYAPFVPPGHALTLWRPSAVAARGVASGIPADWSWARDGISVDAAYAAICTFLDGESKSPAIP